MLRQASPSATLCKCDIKRLRKRKRLSILHLTSLLYSPGFKFSRAYRLGLTSWHIHLQSFEICATRGFQYFCRNFLVNWYWRDAMKNNIFAELSTGFVPHTRGSPFPMETALHYVFLIRYRWLRNLCRFLEFAESPIKFSGESPKSAK